MEFSRYPKRVCVQYTPPPDLSNEQIESIIATANSDPRLHITGDVVLALAETGIRSNELRRLRVLTI